MKQEDLSYRSRVAAAVLEALIRADASERPTDLAAGPNIGGMLDCLTLVGAALLEESGVASSDQEASVIIASYAERTHQRLRELHAFHEETGYALFKRDPS